MRTQYVCDVCGVANASPQEAYRCEASSHGSDQVDPLYDDAFYTIAEVAGKIGYGWSTVHAWIMRHGRVFIHMVDLKDRRWREWAEEHRIDLLTDSRSRYWIPGRDISALEKALHIFGSVQSMRSSGVERVYSADGGEFCYPARSKPTGQGGYVASAQDASAAIAKAEGEAITTQKEAE